MHASLWQWLFSCSRNFSLAFSSCWNLNKWMHHQTFAECKPPLQVHFTTVETEYCIAGCAIHQPIVFCQPALLKGTTLFALFLLAFTETLWSVWHILKNITTLSFAVTCIFNILLLQARWVNTYTSCKPVAVQYNLGTYSKPAPSLQYSVALSPELAGPVSLVPNDCCDSGSDSDGLDSLLLLAKKKSRVCCFCMTKRSSAGLTLQSY